MGMLNSPTGDASFTGADGSRSKPHPVHDWSPRRSKDHKLTPLWDAECTHWHPLIYALSACGISLIPAAPSCTPAFSGQVPFRAEMDPSFTWMIRPYRCCMISGGSNFVIWTLSEQVQHLFKNGYLIWHDAGKAIARRRPREEWKSCSSGRGHPILMKLIWYPLWTI